MRAAMWMFVAVMCWGAIGCSLLLGDLGDLDSGGDSGLDLDGGDVGE